MWQTLKDQTSSLWTCIRDRQTRVQSASLNPLMSTCPRTRTRGRKKWVNITALDFTVTFIFSPWLYTNNTRWLYTSLSHFLVTSNTFGVLLLIVQNQVSQMLLPTTLKQRCLRTRRLHVQWMWQTLMDRTSRLWTCIRDRQTHVQSASLNPLTSTSPPTRTRGRRKWVNITALDYTFTFIFSPWL